MLSERNILIVNDGRIYRSKSVIHANRLRSICHEFCLRNSFIRNILLTFRNGEFALFQIVKSDDAVDFVEA